MDINDVKTKSLSINHAYKKYRNKLIFLSY